jgi:hypothetical protein
MINLLGKKKEGNMVNVHYTGKDRLIIKKNAKFQQQKGY